jgi:hypothetical protein
MRCKQGALEVEHDLLWPNMGHGGPTWNVSKPRRHDVGWYMARGTSSMFAPYLRRLFAPHLRRLV